MLKWILIILLSLIGLAVLAFGLFILYMGPDPVYLQVEQVLEDVKVQPAEALKIAEPHLEKHGTYHWNSELPMTTHIIRGGSWFTDWYYVKRTNYPFKSTRPYMYGAVKVHPQTGQVEYSNY